MRASWWRLPDVWLAFVCVLIFANQILFTVYLLRVKGGDASFISDYLPSGWFELATRNHVLKALADWFPAPHTLSWTVLRAQAFLELPFVLAAYLTVARWFDTRLMMRLTRPMLLWSASAAYTAVFCLIEASLSNPYTHDDIAVRVVSGLATPLAMRCLLGTLIAGTAAGATIRHELTQVVSRTRWAAGLVTTVALGTLAGLLVALIPQPYAEARLLAAAGAFVLAATLAAAWFDRGLPDVPEGAH